MQAETAVSIQADVSGVDDVMARKPIDPLESEEDRLFGEELQAAFGRSVKAARLKARFTQTELADLCNLRQDDISRIEAGNVNVTLRTMARLAKVFGGDVWAMMQGSKADPS